MPEDLDAGQATPNRHMKLLKNPDLHTVLSQTRRARWAVTLLFFLNGASFSAMLPRFPELQQHMGLSAGSFGLAVGLGPIGGLIASVFTARLMRRFGSGRLAAFTQFGAAVMAILVLSAGNWWWFWGALAGASALDALTDISMNAHGMHVQRLYGRSIMNAYHGWWSIGAVTGGILGSILAQLQVPLPLQGMITAIGVGIILLWVRGAVLPAEVDQRETAAETGSTLVGAENPCETAVTGASGTAGSSACVRGVSEETTASTDQETLPAGSFSKLTKPLLILVALGLTLIFAGASEDTGSTWGAIYMVGQFQALPLLAGSAFVALQGAQTIGRLTGDSIVNRFGYRATARTGVAIAFVGMVVALIWATPLTTIVGFALTGWGIATLFPAVFHAADEIPGLKPGTGITFVGWFSRIGFFASPPLIGYLADWLTLRYALWLVPVYLLILFFSVQALPGKMNKNG